MENKTTLHGNYSKVLESNDVILWRCVQRNGRFVTNQTNVRDKKRVFHKLDRLDLVTFNMKKKTFSPLSIHTER